jgi:hypothetical protein
MSYKISSSFQKELELGKESICQKRNAKNIKKQMRKRKTSLFSRTNLKLCLNPKISSQTLTLSS